MKKLLSGNEALARGAYEAGVKVCSAYPGTPSTEVFENLPNYGDALYCEWAPNEKVATEFAYGASMAGVRSLCAMKHVGLNVAADPVFTAAYNGVTGGFVIICADDPNMYSSQNEQDNRHYAKAAKIIMLEPSDSQECLDFIKEAYDISEQFDVPVMIRTTTRIAHSKSLVEFGQRKEKEIAEYVKNPAKYIASPANAVKNHKKLEENMAKAFTFACESKLNRMEMNGTKIGVVAAGMTYQYVKDAFPEGTSFLKLGITNPLPTDLIREFAGKVEKLYVIEELDPFMEEQIKAAGIECEGKKYTGLLYELNPQILKERIFGEKPDVTELSVKAVSRPPALCPGCPHRGFFYVMSKHREFVITGDIGCYTLGGSAPLSSLDSVVCMGGGFSVGAGASKAFEVTGRKKTVFGVLGDSTFFHSGITGAVENLYNKSGMIPVILDNSITGMTGHQENPGSGFNLNGDIAEKIDIENVLRGIGYKKIFIADPQDLKATEAAVLSAAESEEAAAVIIRRPCIMIKRIKHDFSKCTVNTEKCVGCKMCLKVGCPAITVKEGKAHIDNNQCTGCTVCAQVCPTGSIKREEA